MRVIFYYFVLFIKFSLIKLKGITVFWEKGKGGGGARVRTSLGKN